MRVRDDQLKLAVTDSGIGISATALSEIFHPFVQDCHAGAFSGAASSS